MTQLIPSPPWPRSWYNYPIILCGIAIQYVWAIAILVEERVIDITAIRPLLPYFFQSKYPTDYPDFIQVVLSGILAATATASVIGFFLKKKMSTLYALMPQQFVMVVSSVGVLHSMFISQYADGTIRPRAVIVATLVPIVLLTIFHTWSMILILINAGDDEK